MTPPFATLRTSFSYETLKTLIFILLGLAIGLVFVIASESNPMNGLAIAFGIPLILLIIFHPQLGFIFLILIVVTQEEFPSLMGETAERSIRNPIYSKSLGIPGFYSTDLLIFGTIGLYLLRGLILKRPFLKIPWNSITFSLLAMAFVAAFTSLLSIIGGYPEGSNTIQFTSNTSYNINARGAKLIAFFQFKIFIYIFLCYLLGLIWMPNRESIKKFIKIFFVSILICIGIGAFRTVMHFDLVAQMQPLFYHSPSSWVFATAAIYAISCWAYYNPDSRTTLLLTLLSAIMFLFVLSSFRRTMWGGVSLSLIILFAFLPLRAKIRIFVISVIFAAFVATLLVSTSVGHKVLEAVSSRIYETSAEDASSLYRFTLFKYFIEFFTQLPFFGYGIEPLWNKRAHIGFFYTNLENIHSLYFWVLLRMGYIGLSTLLVAIFTIACSLLNYILKSSKDLEGKIYALTLFVTFFIMLFSGIFNPIYGEVRYMVLAGVYLAGFSRLLEHKRNECLL